MSRLYGKKFDAYLISKYLIENNINNYKLDKKKINIVELVDSTCILDPYLPSDALEYLENYPINVVKSPWIPKNLYELPSEKSENATIYFKGVNFKEEDKRDLILFLGTVLSKQNPDKEPEELEFPGEYESILPLLLEYLFLRNNNQEERFSTKHLVSLRYNGEKFIRVHDAYQKYLLNRTNNELYLLNEKKIDQIEENNKENENRFLKSLIDIVVPLSSMDGVLQIIDKVKDEDKLKKIIKELYENKDNNRVDLLKEYEIESSGYKRLRKEIDKYRGI